MNVTTFVRSLLALRSYFTAIAAAGARKAPFGELQRLGIEAERKCWRRQAGSTPIAARFSALGSSRRRPAGGRRAASTFTAKS